jgi:hypothetical protein
MNNNQASSNGAISLSTLLLVVFIILKLTHVIDWSWWWVLAPFWIPLGIGIILLIVAVMLRNR